MTPVFVHGVGVCSSFGTAAETTAALLEGSCAIRPIRAFDATGMPCTVAAEVRRTWPGEDRRLGLAMAAVDELGPLPTGRLGVFVGAESGRANFATVLDAAAAAGGGPQFDHEAFALHGPGLSHRFDTATLSPATVAVRIAERFGAMGPVRTLSLACSSSLAAVVEAVRALRCGAADCAIVGGVGADVDPLMLAGFGLLGALSGRGISRPFDPMRDGFVVGEGAAFLVLSTAASDVRVTGTGRSLDGHHLTKPHPEGRGARSAMKAALGSTPVDLVIAHGTSTPLNDAVEASAIHDLCHGAAVTSLKGALGHWIAGAGALGLAAAVAALRTGQIPPTVGTRDLDADLDVVLATRTRDLRRVLVNALAFGGANSSVVVER